VAVVTPNSPAAKSGFKVGDVIVQFNGQKIARMRELPKVVSSTAVGSRAKVEIIRNGRRRELEVVLGRLEDALAEQAKPQQEQSTKKSSKLRYGMALTKHNANLRRRYSIPDNVNGVRVERVDPSSAAAASGLRGGEIILEVNQQKVRDPRNVYRALDRAKRTRKKAALLRIWRAGNSVFLALSLEKESNP